MDKYIRRNFVHKLEYNPLNKNIFLFLFLHLMSKHSFKMLRLCTWFLAGWLAWQHLSDDYSFVLQSLPKVRLEHRVFKQTNPTLFTTENM